MMIDQKRSDPLSEMIRDAVRDVLNEFNNRPQRNIYTEADVMKMLGVKDKGSMKELRERGLTGHRINYRSWVYLAEDVEAFVRSCNEW